MIIRIVKGAIRRIDRYLENRERVVKVPVPVPVFKQDLLKGRRALITGGGKGIGRGIAKAFLESGCEVVITGRDEQALRESVEEMKSIGPMVSYVVLDNCKVEEFNSCINKLFDRLGSIDILVNNAGFTQAGGFGCSSPEKYDAVFNSVLRGAWFMAETFARVWKTRHVTKANILNVCSVSSFRPGYSPYIMAKWGERSMTIGLAKLLTKDGVVVNGLAPGLTHIERIHRQHAGLSEGIEFPKNPSGRLVTVEELASMAVVLVSDIGRMTAGDVVCMGGGAGIVTIDDL